MLNPKYYLAVGYLLCTTIQYGGIHIDKACPHSEIRCSGTPRCAIVYGRRVVNGTPDARKQRLSGIVAEARKTDHA